VKRVLVRPDLGPTIGAGHAMRDLAIAEALIAEGDEVVYACSTDGVEWVRGAIVARGCAVVPSPAGTLGELATSLHADLVIVDSYTLPTDEYTGVMDRGIPLAAVVDGERRGAAADLLIDPGPSEPGDWAEARASGQAILAGLEYALVREEFRSRSPRRSTEHTPMGVLIAFGGTDAFGLAAAMTRLVLDLGAPLRATVLTRPELVYEVESLARREGQIVTVATSADQFAGLVREQDVVLGAAGSTVSELLAMGTAAGLVCAADNQRRNFDRLGGTGAAFPLGTRDQLVARDPALVERVGRLLGDAPLRRALREAAPRTVDGLGPRRIAAALSRIARVRD